MFHNFRMLPHQQHVLCIFKAQRPQQQALGPREYLRVNHHHRRERAERESNIEPLPAVLCAD